MKVQHFGVWQCPAAAPHSKSFQKLFGADASPRIDRQLHFVDFFVDFLHEMYDKIDQFVFVHLFGVEVRDQKTDVVAFDWFASQHHEIFRTHHHESGEFVAKNFLNFVGLFHGDANAHRIHAALDEYAFFFIARYDHWR